MKKYSSIITIHIRKNSINKINEFPSRLKRAAKSLSNCNIFVNAKFNYINKAQDGRTRQRAGLGRGAVWGSVWQYLRVPEVPFLFEKKTAARLCIKCTFWLCSLKRYLTAKCSQVFFKTGHFYANYSNLWTTPQDKIRYFICSFQINLRHHRLSLADINIVEQTVLLTIDKNRMYNYYRTNIDFFSLRPSQ